MKQCCIECGSVYGEKEPYGDGSFTHGLCSNCLLNLRKKLRHPAVEKAEGKEVLSDEAGTS